jgi:signal transduction histidine kinase
MRTASFGLALLYAALLAASVIIIGAIVYWILETSLERQSTARIDAEIELLQQELRSEGDSELIEEVQRRADALGLDYLLLDAKGARIAGNMPVMPTDLGWSTILLPTELSGARVGRKLHIHSVDLGNGMRLSVADDNGAITDVRHAWIEAAVWCLIPFLLLSVVGGLLLSRGFLRRVDAIRATAESIIRGDLESRIPLRGTNDNFDRLSLTLNQMLDRIQTLMEGVRHMSNHIAHALRTPLGRLQQKIETARQSAPGSPSYETALENMQRETEGILRTFSALLRISKMEMAARQSGFQGLDLSTLLRTVFDAYSAAAEEKGKIVTADIAPSLWTRGDKELLTEAMANLFDNAIKHTPAGTHINISLYRERSSIVATVADNGLGVPPEARDQIFERFYRLDRSANIEGTGLGLAFVAAVAGLHGSKLSASDNSPGLRIELRFDAAKPPNMLPNATLPAYKADRVRYRHPVPTSREASEPETPKGNRLGWRFR